MFKTGRHTVGVCVCVHASVYRFRIGASNNVLCILQEAQAQAQAQAQAKTHITKSDFPKGLRTQFNVIGIIIFINQL